MTSYGAWFSVSWFFFTYCEARLDTIFTEYGSRAAATSRASACSDSCISRCDASEGTTAARFRYTAPRGRQGTAGTVVGCPRLCSWCAPARAARTSHLLLDEAQLVPEGSVELEQWVWAYGRIPNRIDRPGSIWVWWGPVVSVSNHLELELPLQIVACPRTTPTCTPSELVARYRFFPREQDDGWQPCSAWPTASRWTAPPAPPAVEVASC